jgi:hypothetical protein
MTTATDTDICGAETPDGPCKLAPHPRGWHDPNPPTLTVPRGRHGHHQVSISQYRTYGAVDLLGTNHEDRRGCPRAYALRYGQDEAPELISRPAELGNVLHAALQRMEVELIGPEQALTLCWPPTLNFDDFADAREILLAYLDRGGPLTRFATIETELDLTYPLYDDPDHGPVYFRGIVDVVSVDPNDEDVVARIIDYKSAARPVERSSLLGDVQMMGYVWLIRQWWRERYGNNPDRVVAHLDLLRWRDLDIEYTDAELDLWHEWACAMARTMLRDTAPAPILNDGCTYCPVRFSCPAWLALPAVAESISARLTGKSPRELSGQYQRANLVAKLLASQVKDLRGALDNETRVLKRVRVGEQEWTVEPDSKTVVDTVAVADLLLPEHPNAYRLAVNATDTSLGRAVATLDDLTLRDRVLGCVSRVPNGTKIVRKKARNGDGST